ncbi:MAG: CpsD/CapB family tyrosine-protein kinase [Candidatus Thiodiazotropha endolucinida]|nr:CpsD/CapB family tyrosine-protein kinase [Candidatus Thiodiazotropha taylori]MCG8053244.1 CpsD/CapB family tyrosine-protein kinase [Candidatus Thiodiazotropha taylori]MCW4315064.1 CpsD/CapB family tyrosine-protein kinase [Candidatus Thiodiazotropha taylori]MCW4321131.1 CpsD/CapB family tyrosine-protein kinase [Candidatus Thiodiazotropha taylori]
MEKIKQALDRARTSRTKSLNSTVNQREFRQSRHLIDTTQIEYTTTKLIDVSADFLRKNKIIVGDSNNEVSDQYKLLRTQIIQRLKANKWNSIAITSPTEGCGKTLTSINLAISLAREVNHTVLLVDMDLRRPKIHNYFHQEELLGLSDYISENVNLNEMLFNPGIERLVILPGNKPITNSSEMLSSPKLVKLVDELKNRYPNRVILYDMPPLLSCDDMIAFSPYIDSIMLIIEEGKTKKEELKSAYQLIEQANIIGTVLNKSKSNLTINGYY